MGWLSGPTLVVDSTGMTGIPSQFSMIDKQLAEAAIRHIVASQNIANVNTPGFRAQEVASFTDVLSNTEQSSATYSLQSQDGPQRLDGNSVNIDREMGALKKGAISYNVYTQILATKTRQMRSAMDR